MIRTMTFKDIPEVQNIDKLCFNAEYSRRAEGIKCYIEKSNNASIICELDNKVVAYNFIHVWGNFAWFGSFGVHPQYQNRSIGRAMLNHTIKMLKEDYKISNIGLATMPESKYNVGFYIQMGFKPLKLSLGLKKSLDTLSSKFKGKYEVTLADISNEASYENLKETIKTLSNKIAQGLDLSSQLHLIKNGDFGIVFELKHNNQVQGFAICNTKHARETHTDCLEIRLLCITQAVSYKDALDSILYRCTDYAQLMNYKSIYIDCNTYNLDICTYLISNYNFQIEKTRLIMIMGNENYISEHKGLVLCRWAG